MNGNRAAATEAHLLRATPRDGGKLAWLEELHEAWERDAASR